MTPELKAAMQLLKDAGYRVTKPKIKSKTSKGPTAICEFDDGTVTRMTLHVPDQIDGKAYQRAAKLGHYAWITRHRLKHILPQLQEADANVSALERRLDIEVVADSQDVVRELRYARLRRERMLAQWADRDFIGNTEAAAITNIAFERDGAILDRCDFSQGVAHVLAM